MSKINFLKLRQAYKAADSRGKALLEEACGSAFFNMSVMDRVTSIQEACEETGRDYSFEFSPERLKYETEDETGYRELKIIFEALNEGEEIDFTNPKQQKHYGWIDASGRGLALNGVVYDVSATNVGPRLYTVNEKLYRYAFKQFPDSFKKFFSNNKK